MYEPDPQSQTPGPGAAVAAALLGLALGAAALLLATPPGRKLMAQFGDQADLWKAQAAATLAETREKVVTSVEAETPPPDDPGGSRVRERL